MKILVSAYACEPGKGSEPEVGWQWARQIARFHDTWVITRSNNRPLIEEGLKSDPNPNLHFVFADLPSWARFWKKGNRGVHLYHQLWQYNILPLAHKLNREHRFDICHHITFGAVWYPSFLYRLPAKFIWGPFGGGEDAYEACLETLSTKGRMTERIRKCISWYFFQFDPIVRRNFDKASLLLARTEMTAHKIPSKYVSKTEVFLETGFTKIPQYNQNKPCVRQNLFTASRLIPLKNIEIAIVAMRMVIKKAPLARLHIFGDGSLSECLKEMARKLGLNNNICFHGYTEHAALLEIVKEMDLLIHPAVRDGGTHAVMEAMALGIPVICLDNAGPGYMVDSSSGIKITGRNKNDIVQKIADAAIELLTNDDRYNELRMGAVNRVRDHFLWDRIGDRMKVLYQKICAKKF